MLLDDIIKNICDNLNDSKIIILDGPSDIGKSYIIKKVFTSNIIRIPNYYGSENISDDIYYRDFIKIDDIYSKKSNNPMSLLLVLKNKCLEFLENGISLWFSDVHAYKDKFSFQFLEQLIDSYQLSNLKGYLIIECSPEKLTPDNKYLYYKMLSKIQEESKYHLKQKEKIDIDILNCINKSIGDNNISLEIKYFISEACGYKFNLIISLIEYLKYLNVIKKKDSLWECSKININLVKEFLKDYILLRFNILDVIDQNIIVKATISGYEIDIRKLCTIFNENTFIESIPKIELQTHLINNICNKLYKYESQITYEILKDKMSLNEKNNWNLQAAKFYLKATETANPLEKQKILEKVYHHFREANEYNKAFKYLLSYIGISLELYDFQNVIEKGNIALTFRKVKEFKEDYFYFVYYIMAYAYQMLADYESAIIYYEKIIKSNFSDLLLLYHYSTCLFNGGHYAQALETIGIAERQVKNDDSEEYIELIFLKSCIYNHIGENKKSKQYYQKAYDLAKIKERKDLYYKILKCCDMFLDSDLAIDYIEKSYDYFKNKNNFETGKIAYNLGINYLFVGGFDKAEQMFHTSKCIFSRFNTKNLFYPLTGLGIINAIKNNLFESIHLFKNAITYSTDFFAEINQNLNIANCYCLLNEFYIAYKILKKCEQQINETKENTLLLKRNLYLAWATYFERIGDMVNSTNYLENALDTEINKLKYTTYNTLIAYRLMDLYQKQNLEIPDKIITLSKARLSPYKQCLKNQKTVWFYLLFWGL